MIRGIFVHRLDWDGIAIEVSYEPDWLGFTLHLGIQTAHLQVRSLSPKGAQLPITETGYRSHFLPADDVIAAGGALSYVRDWLDEAAAGPEWQERLAASRQLSLF